MRKVPAPNLLQLGSFSFATNVEDNRWCSVNTPNPRRCDQNRICGGVVAAIFDFDGTLTATPGDRAERKYKIAELSERAPLLRPWLRRLRDHGVVLGILSKSSEATIIAALEAAGLEELFDGPVLGKAVGLEGKAGFLEEMCLEGGVFEQLGSDGLRKVLLIDDDVRELARAGERGIQTYAAPEDGGLQEEDFREIFAGLELPVPPQAPQSTEIQRLWSYGLLAESLGLPREPTQVDFEAGRRPNLLDHYDVLVDGEHLGKGSFGIIRPGVHKRTGRRCAMKFIRKDVAGRHYLETFVEKDMYTFLLKMTRQDPHPNVAKQLDYLMGDKVIYNPQELLEGEDLLGFLQEFAPISEALAALIMQQVFAALRHIHCVFQTGLIHRDVKLENLRFRHASPRSDLVLIDFGLSCAARPEQKRTIVGTWMYMAPEVFSQQYNEKVDIWSAGVVLYIILTGRPPWVQDPSKGLAPNEDVRSGKAVQAALDMADIKAAPPLAVDFLNGLLVPAEQRPSAESALAHIWLTNVDKADASIDWKKGPLLSVAKETYSVTVQQSLATPKAQRVGLTWAGSEELQLEAEEAPQLSPKLSPRKPMWSPGKLRQQRPWLNDGRRSRENLGDHPGRTISPVAAAIPEANSQEFQEGSSAQLSTQAGSMTLQAFRDESALELAEVVPGGCIRRHNMAVTEVKPVSCDACCAGLISLRISRWFSQNEESKADPSAT